MRVNIYAEEMTDRVEIIAKEIEGRVFTGLRFYLELPATVGGQQYQGPFMHRPSDDDSGAVTFWGKRDLRVLLRKALAALDKHYALHDEEREKWMTRATSTDDTESAHSVSVVFRVPASSSRPDVGPASLVGTLRPGRKWMSGPSLVAQSQG